MAPPKDDEHVELDGMVFNEEQIGRQVQRIQEAVMTNKVDYESGAYSGKVCQEVMDLFHNHLTFNEAVEEVAFHEQLQEIMGAFVVWIVDHVPGVHEQVAAIFVQEFVPTILEQVFSFQMVEGPDSPPDYDPAYS